MTFILKLIAKAKTLFFAGLLILLNAVWLYPLNAIEGTKLTPSVLDLTSEFSDKFCLGISNGLSPDAAGKAASKKIISGLIFSPLMKEISEAPKSLLVTSLSSQIFNQCGSELGVTEEELHAHLLDFANRTPRLSTTNFPVVKQKRS